MERSVVLLVAGGCLLVTGLWIVRLSATATAPSLVGLVLAVVGLGGLGFGGWRLLDSERHRSTM